MGLNMWWPKIQGNLDLGQAELTKDQRLSPLTNCRTNLPNSSGDPKVQHALDPLIKINYYNLCST